MEDFTPGEIEAIRLQAQRKMDEEVRRYEPEETYSYVGEDWKLLGVTDGFFHKVFSFDTQDDGPRDVWAFVQIFGEGEPYVHTIVWDADASIEISEQDEAKDRTPPTPDTRFLISRNADGVYGVAKTELEDLNDADDPNADTGTWLTSFETKAQLMRYLEMSL